jgi:hypothetical protein
MSPKLLRPRPRASGGYDPDAQRYFDAVESAEGQQLESLVKKAISDFIVGCKADGIWPAIKASCILMGARTLSGALTPLVGAAPTNNNFVSGDYNRKTGLVGDGFTKHLSCNRNNNADPQNSHHIATFVTVDAFFVRFATEYPIYIGAGGTLNGATNVGLLADTGSLFSRSRSSDFSDVASAGVGLTGLSRSTAGSYVVRSAGVSSTVTQASENPADADVSVLWSNNDAGLVYSNARIAFYSVGESLSLALLDSRVSALRNAIGVAIP